MTRHITCIECPKGCNLSVEVEHGRVLGISGNKCPEGEQYAILEIENPVRILTSTVKTEGLELKMAPVRTDRPIPKANLLKAMEEINKIKLTKPVCAGESIMENFAGLNVSLIVTRDCLSDMSK